MDNKEILDVLNPYWHPEENTHKVFTVKDKIITQNILDIIVKEYNTDVFPSPHPYCSFHFIGCNLDDRVFNCKKLHHGYGFYECSLQRSTFDNIDLDESKFYSCDLREASFKNTNFGFGKYHFMRDCKIEGAIFTDAYMEKVNIGGTPFKLSQIDQFEQFYAMLSPDNICVHREEKGLLITDYGEVLGEDVNKYINDGIFLYEEGY